MPDFTPGQAGASGALKQLAACFSPDHYRATLVTRPGQPPCLTVTNRHATLLTEDIYAGHGWYWWPWAERLAPVTDPATAAARITRVLRARAEPAHG